MLTKSTISEQEDKAMNTESQKADTMRIIQAM